MVYWTNFFSSVPFRKKCEGDGDVVGVVTPLGGVAQVLHDDQVVELTVQLAVQEVEGKEDREGQVEVEEKGLYEKRTRTWMTSDETQIFKM